MKKFKMLNQKFWKTHRFGWKYVLDNLYCLHNDNGVLFNGALDEFFIKKQRFTESWVGFLHHPPHHPDYIPALDVSKILQSRQFLESESLCKGIFVLSDYLKNFIVTKTNIPIFTVKHPTCFVDNVFTFEKFILNQNKKIILLGHWLRKYQSFCNLNSPYEKFILNVSDKTDQLLQSLNKQKVRDLKDVKIMLSLKDMQYDELLSKNIVFLDLYDSSANNAIIECIVRNTPILINKIPPVVEYLGEDYPFYYSNIEEANSKINNLNLIEDSCNYLFNLDKSCLKIEDFIYKIENSNIYKNLKLDKKIPLF